MPTSADFTKKEKGCALIIGFIECLLFGGVIYGWADLVYVMKAEGIFYNKCTNVTAVWNSNYGSNKVPSCKSQDKLFDLAFTIASFGRGLGTLFVSLLLDYTGIRITRLVAIFSIIIGGFFTGFCSEAHPYYLFPGSLLIALGGAEIRLADFKIANMFPKHKATVISVYNGAFCGSSAVFLVLKYVYDDTDDRATFLYVWTGISGLMLFPTFLLLPKCNIEAIDEAERMQQLRNDDDEHQLLLPPDESVNIRPDPIQKNSFLRSFCTISFWLHIYASANIALGITLYVASFNLWVNNVSSDREEVNYLTEIYGFCQLPMIVVAPFTGILMDTAVKRALREQEDIAKRKKLQQAGFVALMVSSITVILLAICKIFKSIVAVKLSLAVYTLANPTMNAIIPGYIRIRFHQDHFNKLMGIVGTTYAIYSLLQFPLFRWIQNDPVTSNIVVSVLMATTLINALHLLCLKVR